MTTRERRETTPSDPLPSFTVVVPTRGRPEPLTACMEALARLDYPTDRFEAVVVDDGSAAPIEPLGRGPEALRVVRQPHAGPAAARNTGAAHADGEFLAFTDDDCLPRPDWLRAFAVAFQATPDHLLGGRTVNALPANPFASASQQLIDYLYEYYDGSEGRARLFTSNNMAVRRSRFMDARGFDTRFPRAGGEDREFCHRWGGGRATYVPDAVVDHAHDLTLRTFLRQHYNYGRGGSAFRRAQEEQGADVPLEPFSFYLGLIRYPLARSRRPRRWLEAALLATTQAANAAGFFREAVLP
jgi:glycosyltransferase involved in cell wall biosynthesis